jgi:hypothetical protein
MTNTQIPNDSFRKQIKKHPTPIVCTLISGSRSLQKTRPMRHGKIVFIFGDNQKTIKDMGRCG